MTKAILLFLFVLICNICFGQATISDSSHVFIYEICVFKKGKPGRIIKNEMNGIGDTIVAFVSGHVYIKGETGSFANISFTNKQGKLFGTQTDVDGNYKIWLPSDKYAIKFSYVGFSDFNIYKLQLGKGQMQDVSVDLGGAGVFTTYAVTFDHKPTKKELNRKEKELSQSPE